MSVQESKATRQSELVITYAAIATLFLHSLLATIQHDDAFVGFAKWIMVTHFALVAVAIYRYAIHNYRNNEDSKNDPYWIVPVGSFTFLMIQILTGMNGLLSIPTSIVSVIAWMVFGPYFKSKPDCRSDPYVSPTDSQMRKYVASCVGTSILIIVYGFLNATEMGPDVKTTEWFYHPMTILTIMSMAGPIPYHKAVRPKNTTLTMPKRWAAFIIIPISCISVAIITLIAGGSVNPINYILAIFTVIFYNRTSSYA